jgi:glycerol-3-phosphate dehydrogenase
MLARRWRLLFLDARLADSIAAAVGAILREETGVDPCIAEFQDLARLYVTAPA